MAWLSIAGLYRFDDSIFDTMSIPTGIDKDVLVYTILSETAELELLFPDAGFMKKSIEMWSLKNIGNWEKMLASLKAEYNPIENYDRNESWTDSNTVSGKVAAYNEAELVESQKNDADSTHTGRVHGNVGVTTNQQMIESEMVLRTRYNIYDVIVQDFKNRFCIMVY